MPFQCLPLLSLIISLNNELNLQDMKWRFAFYLNLLICSSSAQTYNIILGRPTDTSITASVLFHQDVQCFLEYGTLAALYTSSTDFISVNANQPVELDIKSLKSDTKYFYRLRYHLTGNNLFCHPLNIVFIHSHQRENHFLL
jgi:hypothetical protein